MSIKKHQDDLHGLVTNKVIEFLMQGVVPWKKPWRNGLPKNMLTRKSFSGVNVLLLNSLDYPTHDYLTVSQLRAIGGTVRQGEKPHVVVCRIESEFLGNLPPAYLLLKHYYVYNRKEIVEPNRYGSDQYSLEELVAEIGSCYLQTLTGIYHETISNSGAYIQGWLQRLKNDKRFIIHASGQAQKAVDYIMNVKAVEEVKQEESEEVERAVA